MSYRISRGALVGVWIITALLTVIFMNAGIRKFGPRSFWTPIFQHWGLPHWFQLTIGVEEVVAAALLMWPKTARLGAVVIASIMLGAVTVGAVHHDFRSVPGELIVLVFTTVIFAARQSMETRHRGEPAASQRPSQTRHP